MTSATWSSRMARSMDSTGSYLLAIFNRPEFPLYKNDSDTHYVFIIFNVGWAGLSLKQRQQSRMQPLRQPCKFSKDALMIARIHI